MQKWIFVRKRAICESNANVHMSWGHKVLHNEGLDTNAHRYCVQVVQKKEESTIWQHPAKQEHPRNCATAQKLPPPEVKKKSGL